MGLARSGTTEVNAPAQRTSLAQNVSFYAQCTWYQDRLKGDATRRAADQATIGAMPSWKYWAFAGLVIRNEHAPRRARVGLNTAVGLCPPRARIPSPCATSKREAS